MFRSRLARALSTTGGLALGLGFSALVVSEAQAQAKPKPPPPPTPSEEVAAVAIPEPLADAEAIVAEIASEPLTVVEAIMAEIASLRVLASSTDAGTRWRTNGCRTGPLVLVGTGGGSDSVYAYRVAPDHASIMPVGIALKVGTNPSFIAQAKSGGVVYVASEGCVTAVAVEPHEPALRLLGDAQASEGAGTSHCSLDAGGLHVLAANYIGGSVCVLPIEEDGSVGAAIDSKHHAGAGTFLDRQEAAHPHSIRVDPWGGTWAFVPDLGLDTLFVYAYNSIQGVLAGTNSDTRHWRAPKGAGPRHIAFSPLSRPEHLVYALNEMHGTVSVLSHNDSSGALTEKQTVSLLPPDVNTTRQGHTGSAEIAMHPSGKFVYASNRQNHSISVMSVSESTGLLTLHANVPSGGKTPRHFQISPAGDYLIVGNQSSNNIATFTIDKNSGLLSEPTITAMPQSPRCICILDDADAPLKL